MKFYKALEKLLKSKIEEGCSECYIVNRDWNGLKNDKEMLVQVRHQQEDPTYSMEPYLEMTTSNSISCKCIPWIPSFLDIFSDKWEVWKYDKSNHKKENISEDEEQ